jgi:hypothetical protein
VSYIQKQSLDGAFTDWFKDKLGTAKDIIVKGAKEQYLPKPAPPPVAKQESFMDKYGTVVLIGGFGLAAIFAYKALKK